MEEWVLKIKEAEKKLFSNDKENENGNNIPFAIIVSEEQ